MKTEYIKTDADNIDLQAIKKAGMIIRSGGLVAFPTETVYGLGGDALNAGSSQKIYEAKGRPSDNPLIVHIAQFDSIYKIASYIPPAAEKLAKMYWPGPLTIILKKTRIVPDETTGNLPTVAVRFPSHPVAQLLIKEAGGYIAAPSANISGRPSPTTGEHVAVDMDGRIDMIIDSGPCRIGLESTIIDFTCDVPMMLRPGYVSQQMLEDVIGTVEKDPAVFGEASEGVKPKAPGMKYRHYAPRGVLTIVSGKKADVINLINDRTAKNSSKVRTAVLCRSENTSCYPQADLVIDMGDDKNEEKIASRLYDSLRKCDEENIDEIYSEEFDTPGLGLAIMNRLIKAAGHNLIRV